MLFDLEVLADMKAAEKVWFQLSNYPGLTIRASINSIICFGYQTFGEKEIHCKNAWDFPKWNKNVNDDRPLCEFIYNTLKDADAVVTHNGKRFDWKFLQTRLLIHKMPPLPKIKHVDTCSLSKSNLLLFNNKLSTVGSELTDESKMESGGQDLWTRVRARDHEAMDKMTKYCKQDVRTLNAAFKVLRPFATNIPNYNLYPHGGDKVLCPSCGSTRLKKEGFIYTKTGSNQRYKCIDCHTYCSDRTNNPLPR